MFVRILSWEWLKQENGCQELENNWRVKKWREWREKFEEAWVCSSEAGAGGHIQH